MPDTAARRFDRRLLLAAFAVAFAVRVLPLPAATAGGLRLLSPDCYGHLRRSLAVARHFPHVPTFDPTLAFPDGAVWIWAPSFDLLVGGLSRTLFGADVGMERVAWVGAFTAPVLGALHVFPLLAFARRALSRRRAYAAMPGAVLWGCFGHVDHHVAEALLLLMFLATCAAAVETGLAPRTRLRRAVLAGTLLGLAVLTWHGAVFIAALALPWAALALGPFAALLAAVAASVAALGTALVLLGKSVPFSFVSFGWFQPLFLAALALPLAVLAAFQARRRARVLAAAAALVLAALVLPNTRALAGAVFRGSAYVAGAGGAHLDDYDHARGGYLSYPPELLRLIFEARPLLADGASAAYAVRELSLGLVLLPVALFLWTRSARRRRRDARLLLALFAAALLVMTLLQKRNTYYLAAFTALAVAEAVARVKPPRIAPRTLGLAIALSLVVLPGLPLLARVASYADAPGRDFLDLMRRLARLDPPPADLADLPPASATTGVMCPWSAGHYVSALSGRPAAADPFGYGFRRQCRLYTTADAEEARAILVGARCRYLVTADLPDAVLLGYAEAAGRAGTLPSAMLLDAVHLSHAERPVPFLTLVVESRSASLAGQRLVPRFKVYRVAGVDDPP
jgi:asparagine N-glycosylation enzyme membrane subunit Stt3